MKPIFGFFVLAAFCMSFSGCTKNDVEPFSSELQTEDDENFLSEAVESFSKGIVVPEKSALCLIGRDGMMHGVVPVFHGDFVDILCIDSVPELLCLEEKNEIPHAGVTQIPSKEVKYYHAVHDDVDFWILESQCAMGAENAVVVRKCAVFKDESMTVPFDGGRMLSFGTDIISDGKGMIYLHDGNKTCRAYANSECLSSRIDDLEVVRIAKKLQKTTRATARNELFRKAAKYTPCAEVSQFLESQKVEKVVNNYDQVVKDLMKVNRGVCIPELLTVDQSKDPFQ